MKYGKLSKEELELTSCPFDSNASAVVLGDIGNSKFIITQEDLTIEFVRHVRIKIFGKESFDKGNFKIYLYKSNSSVEILQQVKGCVYNVKNGQVIKSKLSKDNINTKEADKNNDVVTISMPDIQEGSIIDLIYTISSPFLFNLQSWNFQTDIPTIHSEYKVGIIEWLTYKNWIEGYSLVDLVEENRIEHFSYTNSERVTTSSKGPTSTVNFDAIVNYKTYSIDNVPAFKNEPYITTPADYLSSVQFELLSTMFPWSVFKPYSTNWENVNNMLLEHADFGTTLKTDWHLKDLGETIAALKIDPIQKAALAYESIVNTMIWDNRYRLYTDNSIRKAFNDHIGNSAEINLNLVALCCRVGLESYPVIISTRSHGKIRPGLVSTVQFNHVVAAVKINDSYLLMDATNKNCPYDLLPPQCLNGKVRLIRSGEGDWVDLYSAKSWVETYYANLELTEDLNLKGDLSIKATDYAALSIRKDYRKVESEEDFLIELEEELGSAEITDISIENLDTINLPVLIKSNITFKDRVSNAGDLLLLNPKIIEKMTENVFKSEERKYPVDYNYPLKKQYCINIKIPEDYVFEEVPDQLVISLPENQGRYFFSVNVIGNTLSMNCTFQINETIFPNTEYTGLKKFYDMMVTKEAEQVVIKKI